jgi:exopolysaccharide biosynthesis WecB/TagA/CpsF family protein
MVLAAAAPRLTFPPRYPVTGIMVSAATYDSATAAVIAASRARRSLIVSAAPVHVVTLGATDPEYGAQLNEFELVVPDGQPVRWALRLLHGVSLPDRVYGPTLMLRVCEEAAKTGQGIYLYGSRPEVLERLRRNLIERFPGLRISGATSPPFRPITPEEDAEHVREIRESGAEILFVGLGCPKQEAWANAHRARLPMPMLCVGAAFDFHAGLVRQAPSWMQGAGLEWVFRLSMEPRRLWKRYARYNPLFVGLVARQLVGAAFSRRDRAVSQQTATP